MAEMVSTRINGRWTLALPSHRAARPEWATGWEVARLDAMHKAIRHTDTLYEVGTEEGDMSALLAQWCGRIHLFEPNDRVWPNVRAIWDANGLPAPAGCWSGFAGDSTEVLGAAWPPDASWPPSAYGPVIGDHGFCQLGERPDLPRIRLDDYADGTGDPPDVITMDVEGSELRVLRGAERLLREERPLVFVSVHPESMVMHYGDYENELHHYMAGLGYEGAWLAHDHETHYLFQHPLTARLGVTPREVYSL